MQLFRNFAVIVDSSIFQKGLIVLIVAGPAIAASSREVSVQIAGDLATHILQDRYASFHQYLFAILSPELFSD